jgi:hypothetical protein
MNALRFSAAVTTVAGILAAALGSCGNNTEELWLCLNPVTGKEDNSVYDANHFVNGVADPCHCYDPGGPSKSCPIVVDAGSDAADSGPDAP